MPHLFMIPISKSSASRCNIRSATLAETRRFRTSLAIATVVSMTLLSGCGVFSAKHDETTGWPARQLYSAGKEEMSSGGYEQAIGYFDKIRSRYPNGTYALQAEIDSIYSYYKEGNQQEALAAADQFLKAHPNSAQTDYVLYMRGLINFNDRISILNFIGREDASERDPKAARDAFDSFRILVERYPQSKYAPDAIARMKYLVNALAEYDVHVATYYYRRGAYVAAVNRAQHAVQTYPNAPAVYNALTIMIQSYNAMGMDQLRDDAKRVQAATYPKGAVEGTNVKLDKPWWKIW